MKGSDVSMDRLHCWHFDPTESVGMTIEELLEKKHKINDERQQLHIKILSPVGHASADDFDRLCELSDAIHCIDEIIRTH